MVGFISKRLRNFSEWAEQPVTQNLTPLVGIIQGLLDDLGDFFSNRWCVLDEASSSIEEYTLTGKIVDHINVRTGVGWSTKQKNITLQQYLLLYHRRAFLFMRIIPVEKSRNYLLDKDLLVRCLAKWRML